MQKCHRACKNAIEQFVIRRTRPAVFSFTFYRIISPRPGKFSSKPHDSFELLNFVLVTHGYNHVVFCRSYSSRSRSRSPSPVEKRSKYRDGLSPSRKHKKNSHLKDYKDDYYPVKEKRRKHRRSPSYSPSRSRSISPAPIVRLKPHKKHRYRSRSRTPDRYSRVEKFRDRSRSRSRERVKSKKRNGHHRSHSRDRYRR